MAAQRQPQDGATPKDQVAWPADATPHGYDECEFAPEQCTRDFSRSRRPREPDEERRQLRAADAAIGDADSGAEGGAASTTPADWDDDDPEVIDGSSRLYKD